jgi:hypothetical protein
MYEYILEEMADAISKELRVDNAEVLSILGRYWQDRIAHVWQVDDVFESARRAGKPITREDATEVLQEVFDHLDSDLGITWMTLDIALEDYKIDLRSLPVDQHCNVHGVFKVWCQGDPSFHQFGTYPQKADGNLPAALAFAKELAQKNLGVLVFVGCEPCHHGEAELWLTITLKDGESEPIIEESEAVCSPSSSTISAKE